jgi:hypothetical protein
MENHDTAWLDLADAVTALRNQLRFGVVSVGAGGEHARKATHTVSRKLSAYGDGGSPVDIGDDEP